MHIKVFPSLQFSFSKKCIWQNNLEFNVQRENLSYCLQTASYSRVPPSISGMRLVDVCKTMTGSAFQYQRLRLNFVPSHFGFSHCDSLQSVVVDDIVGMKVGNLLCLIATLHYLT